MELLYIHTVIVSSYQALLSAPMELGSLTQDRNHPNHWFNRASDLHASAGAIWHAMESPDEEEIAEGLGLPEGFSMSIACLPVYYMLCGLAIEVAMKAVLVQRGVQEKAYATHALRDLAGSVGLLLSEDETALLRFYEESLVWAGRYPLPKRATDAKLRGFSELARDVLTMSIPSSSSLTLRTGSGAADWAQFTKLWRRIASGFRHE